MHEKIKNGLWTTWGQFGTSSLPRGILWIVLPSHRKLQGDAEGRFFASGWSNASFTRFRASSISDFFRSLIVAASSPILLVPACAFGGAGFAPAGSARMLGTGARAARSRVANW